MMFEQKFIESAWNWLAPKVSPDSQNVLNQAMNVGQSSGSVSSVMNMLEQYAQNTGNIGVLQNNASWQALKNKTPDEVIPYAKSALSEMNLLGRMTKALFGGK